MEIIFLFDFFFSFPQKKLFALGLIFDFFSSYESYDVQLACVNSFFCDFD